MGRENEKIYKYEAIHMSMYMSIYKYEATHVRAHKFPVDKYCQCHGSSPKRCDRSGHRSSPEALLSTCHLHSTSHSPLLYMTL